MVAESIYGERGKIPAQKEDGFAEKQWPALLEKAVLFQFWSVAPEWFVKSKLLNRKLNDTDDRKWVSKEGCG